MRELNRVIVSSIPARGEVYSIHLKPGPGFSLTYVVIFYFCSMV
jgi:hypothetical protein